MSLSNDLTVRTTEMHTAGEPVRIVESGVPEVKGQTILDKRRYAKEQLDAYRKLLMFEPRGHYDMYGVLKVTPDLPEADMAVLFMHNAGFAPMCGHAVISLGRYAVDTGIVKEVTSPETSVAIQCPCGLVRTFVEWNSETKKSGRVRFHSVPSFAFALDVCVDVSGHGEVEVDVGYGGAFYAYVPAATLGLSLTSSPLTALKQAATAVSDAVRAAVPLRHPDNQDLAFLYGVILTDGGDTCPSSTMLCVFADQEVDRSPCGSGTSGRLALLYARRLIGQNESRDFRSAVTKATFQGQVVKETKCGEFDAVVAQVAGHGYYTGTSSFTLEAGDPIGTGFLAK